MPTEVERRKHFIAPIFLPVSFDELRKQVACANDIVLLINCSFLPTIADLMQSLVADLMQSLVMGNGCGVNPAKTDLIGCQYWMV